MQRYRAIAALTIAAFFTISPPPLNAADDEAARVASAVQRAAAAVASFRVTLSAMQSLNSTTIFVRPDRIKSEMSFGGVTSETIVIGSTSYVRINGGAWLVSKMQNAMDLAQQFTAALESGTKYTLLPDRQESGVTYGAFSSTTAAAPTLAATDHPTTTTTPATPTTMQCTYDKVTYLLHVCTVQPSGVPFPMTLTYSAWNDPANTVEVPAGAPAAN